MFGYVDLSLHKNVYNLYSDNYTDTVTYLVGYWQSDKVTTPDNLVFNVGDKIENRESGEFLIVDEVVKGINYTILKGDRSLE